MNEKTLNQWLSEDLFQMCFFFLHLSISFMSLQTAPITAEIIDLPVCFGNVLFFFKHGGRFCLAIRPICCTGSSPSLERRGEGLEATYSPPSSLSSPFINQHMCRQGEVNAEVVRMCMSEIVCENTRKEGTANQSITRYLPPRVFVWSAPSPPQWFLLQYKSQPAPFSLTYTHTCTLTHTHTDGDRYAHTRKRAQILLQLASAQSRLRGCTSQIVFQMCHLCMGLLPLLLALSPLPPVPQRDFCSAPASAASSSSAPSSTSGNWPVCLCS